MAKSRSKKKKKKTTKKRSTSSTRKKTSSKKASSSRSSPSAKKRGKKTSKKKTSTGKKRAGVKKKVTRRKKTASKTASSPASPKKRTKKPASRAAASGAGEKASKKTASAKSSDAGKAAGADEKKGRKGITVVDRKQGPKRPPPPKYEMPKAEPLLKPGGKWKPLIPSGPKAGAATEEDQAAADGGKRKPKLTKRELEKYRKILLQKRSELLGDVTAMEGEALRGSESGGLSHTPQHMAEQGSDAYDQSLSLDLASFDRTLIKEIDEALERIQKGTYGICELSGAKIRADRLEELPWTRYSIEAARELERRRYGK